MLRYLCGVNVARCPVNICEDWAGAAMHYHVDGGWECNWRSDHFVAWPDPNNL
jgi:hypothetical protein